MSMLNNTTEIAVHDQRVITDACGRKVDLIFTNTFGEYAWITKVTFPILLATGTIGNVLGIVCACKNKKGSQKVFLTAVYITSLLFLWTELINFLGSGTWFEPTEYQLYSNFYTLTGGFWVFLQYVFYVAAICVLLIFCVDRCIAVAFPMYHYTRRCRYFAGISILSICFLAVVNSVITPVLYYWNLSATGNLANGQAARKLSAGLLTWREIDSWVEVIFCVAIYGTIFVSNIVLVYHLHRNRRRRSANSTAPLHPETSSSSNVPSNVTSASCNSLQKSNCIIVSTKCVPSATRSQILIASAVFYLITHSLTVTMSILTLVSQQPFCWFQITMPFLLIYDPFRILMEDIYFSLGFLFLIWLGATEKKKLRAMLCPKCDVSS